MVLLVGKQTTKKVNEICENDTKKKQTSKTDEYNKSLKCKVMRAQHKKFHPARLYRLQGGFD